MNIDTQIVEAFAKELPIVELEVEQTEAAFRSSIESYTTFDRTVQQYFYDEYLPHQRSKIELALAKMFASNDQLLISSFIGKLQHKLPPVYVPGFNNDYYNAKGKLLISAVIAHCLKDAHTVPSKVEVKKNAEGKWETLTHMYLGGNPVKDLLKGVHLEPGVFTQKSNGGWKLRAKDKERGRRLSSIPFQIADIATEELIMHGYSLKSDWNKRKDSSGRSLPEDFNTKVARYEHYKNLILGLKGQEFYLEPKYSGSGRMFYRCQLEGMRPQGKLWETLMIDSSDYHYVDSSELKALKHLIYCTVTGDRVTPDYAAEHINQDILSQANVDPLLCTDEEEFGEAILLNKASKALQDSIEGLPTNFLFGWDFTNSGLIMAGVSFHEPKMMEAGNVHTHGNVVDMHSKFGKAYNLDITRKEIKKVHMPLLHGSTLKGLLNKVHAITGDTSLTLQDVKDKNTAAYGACVDNLIDIADWGVSILSNKQSTFSWTLPDGFRATHKAYFESAEVRFSVASASERHAKTCKTSHTLFSNMPYATDNKGNPLVVDATAKVRGLYANITHSLDAYVLRGVSDGLLDRKMPVLLKHDDYMVHPSAYTVVLDESRKVFNELYETNLYQEAINEIGSNALSEPAVPTLIMGNAANVINEAQAFLMP